MRYVIGFVTAVAMIMAMVGAVVACAFAIVSFLEWQIVTPDVQWYDIRQLVVFASMAALFLGLTDDPR